jgi:hypothetical protein
LAQKNIYIGENLFTVSKKTETSLNLFWYGTIVYIVFFVLAAAETSFISPANCQAFQIIGFLGMAVGGYDLIKFKFDSEYQKILFIFNLLYSATIVLRGAEYNKDAIKQMFLDPTYGILPYFASVVMLLPKNISAYKKVFNVLLILGGFFLISVVVFYNILHDYDWLNLVSQSLVENLSVFLALPIGFLLLNYIYFSGKKTLLRIGIKNMFAILVILVTLFFAIFRARRGLIFMCASTMACVGMIYIISTKQKMLIIFVAVILVAVASVSVSDIKLPAIFNFLAERADKDTRTGVEVWMYADMSPSDWVIGKGIKGKYYCPIVENVNDAEGAGYRDNIETGYLQIILKGGILSLGLLLLLFIPAVYKGFFKSKNVLSKAASMWIFLWIVYLYPAGGIVFTMNYLLVWIAVGICYSDKIRNMSDDNIKTYLMN